MNQNYLNHFFAVALALGIASDVAHSQSISQTSKLSPGWNAVYLEAQPEPSDCASVFAGLPIESVWYWKGDFSSVQFIQDASELDSSLPEWLTYTPPNAERQIPNSLFAIEGGRPYLIKVAESADPFDWVVTGRPIVRSPDWRGSSFNLVGFSVNSEAPPTFQSFFDGSPELSGQAAYRLTPSGRWEEVLNPGNEPVPHGEAFWYYCAAPTEFAGPLNVGFEFGSSLDYERLLQELTLQLRNDSTATQTVSLQDLNFGEPDAVQLSYHEFQPTGEFGWNPLGNTGFSTTLAPGESRELRLSVRRSAMPESITYSSLLDVTDEAGSHYRIPVSARGLSFREETLNSQSLGDANDSVHPFAGLWVGSAEITRVNEPSDGNQRNVPKPTATEFPLRLILHVDRSGRTRLLQKVILMWKNGTSIPSPDDPNLNVVEESGRYVLVTDDALLPQFSGSALRDGDPVGRRLSSVAFGFRDPILMNDSGEFGMNGATVAATIPLPYDDPLNPFVHKYHPHHDNYGGEFKDKLDEGRESYRVIREVTLEFTGEDPDLQQIAGWGDTRLGGVYREKIQGLHRRDLFVEGVFRLHQASRISSLNDR